VEYGIVQTIEFWDYQTGKLLAELMPPTDGRMQLGVLGILEV
jgi:hypothetical protein